MPGLRVCVFFTVFLFHVINRSSYVSGIWRVRFLLTPLFFSTGAPWEVCFPGVGVWRESVGVSDVRCVQV